MRRRSSYRGSSRRTAAHALALALMLGSSGAAWAALPGGAAAQIVHLEGLGEQRNASASQWRSAHNAQLLATGDFVRTHEAARMALVFADETQLRLHHHSVLQIKALASTTDSAQESSRTQLRLDAGRAWTQTRRPNASTLELQTPAATAAIRGTDWEVDVGPDGRTLLTVLSGRVQFHNEYGRLELGPNEAAVAEVGKAPVRWILAQPRARVQWVNALRADPTIHLRTNATEPALQPAIDALQAGDFARAQPLLEEHIRSSAKASALAWLLLTDLWLMQGQTQAVEQTLQTALTDWPEHAGLWAQRARAQLLADEGERAAVQLASAPARTRGQIEWVLARAAVAQHQGDAPTTLAAYQQATTLAPDDARGWQGLGSSLSEREDIGPARAHLQRAFELDPHALNLQGERATLETLTNHFDSAHAAFDAALGEHPQDYVAHTGLGLLHLKQGQPEAALQAFLRATVIEPRYARAKTWTAVAYYQLARQRDALLSLEQACALDDKDPLPWMLLAQIHTDLFEPGLAVQAARAALERMPYLKSLNQLANDQKGSANLGAALAFFGMEDWALELAQQSFSPYWGGSHLFLADRYRGEFNKNSALFQGFLTDPHAFGASPRYASLLQRPGNYATLGATVDHDFYRMQSPSVTLNGTTHRQDVALSWFLKAQDVQAQAFPLDVGVVGYPLFHDPTGRAQGSAQALTLGLGLEPSERIKLFAYGNYFGLKLDANNRFTTHLQDRWMQGALGLSYRWSPAAQTWFKLGRSTDRLQLQNYPVAFNFGPMWGVLGLSGLPQKQFSDVQLRHTEDPAPGTRWSWTLEHVRERQNSQTQAAGTIEGELGPGQSLSDLLYFVARNRIERNYSALTLDGQHALDAHWRADVALSLQHLGERIHGGTGAGLLALDMQSVQRVDRDERSARASPRVGLIWQPHAGSTLRLAYQEWMRPLSVSTLTRVDTAGIALEDRLLEAAGSYRRHVLQWNQTLTPETFMGVTLDHLRLNNPGTVGVDLRTPSLPFLDELRNAQLLNLSTSDLLEASPNVEQGRLSVLGAAVNHMASRHTSIYAKYLHQYGRSSYQDSVHNAWITDRTMAFIPRHTLALGSTWVSASRWYVSARTVYRSQRFEDKENLTLRPSGWMWDIMGFWQSPEKHWSVGAAALNLSSHKLARQSQRYVVQMQYRF